MTRFFTMILTDFSHDATLLHLELTWKYGPILHDIREFVAQSAVDFTDYMGDRADRLCDWLVPLRYRR